MRLGESDKQELEFAFQVVEDVRKPLLAVSSIVKQGHKVVFAEVRAHILLSSGKEIPMRHVQGTYELDMWVNNPSFAW